MPGDLAGPLQLHPPGCWAFGKVFRTRPGPLSWPSAGIRDSQGTGDDSRVTRVVTGVPGAGRGRCAGCVRRPHGPPAGPFPIILEKPKRAKLPPPPPASGTPPAKEQRPCGALRPQHPGDPPSLLQLQTRASFCCQPRKYSHCLESAKRFPDLSANTLLVGVNGFTDVRVCQKAQGRSARAWPRNRPATASAWLGAGQGWL